VRAHKKILAAAVAVATLDAGTAQAVYLDADGLGQALIYPYYTARSDERGNPYNTYLAVTNTDSSGKSVRVRLREAAAGNEVASFNVFLSPGDMWTAAVVPDGEGAKLISTDRSCTEPAFAAGAPGVWELSLRIRDAAPGSGDAFSRAREGFVEMFEMATVRDGTPTASAISQSPQQGPANCAMVRGAPAAIAADLDPPRGSLMGSLTLINVATGRDATVNAEALGALATTQFFRPGTDPVVDFNAPQITPVSVITTAGKRHRLAWTRGIDAVTSVLMQSTTANEFVLDTNTASVTDWIVTMPTRHYYRAGSAAQPPFVSPGAPRPQCDTVEFVYSDREERSATADNGSGWFPWIPAPATCYSASVVSIANAAAHTGHSQFGEGSAEVVNILDTVQNGHVAMSYVGTFDASHQHTPPYIESLAGSSVTDISTGVPALGRLRVYGLPVVGFSSRTFSNGTLACAGGACQGNYASAFPHQAIRSVVSAP